METFVVHTFQRSKSSPPSLVNTVEGDKGAGGVRETGEERAGGGISFLADKHVVEPLWRNTGDPLVFYFILTFLFGFAVNNP